MERTADDSLGALVGHLRAAPADARTLKTLEVLRTKVLTQKNGVTRFRECGGLDRLVILLRKGCERVQDSTLSVLATCCLEDESCIAVGKLNVSVPLVSIVKTSSRDSVMGRACRLLGNLARMTSNAENLHAAGAVAALLAMLQRRDDTMSYPTLVMLVRAIRYLWMVPEKRDDMLTAGVVKDLAVLLTTECETAGLLSSSRTQATLRKSQEELFVGLLKCLGYFSTLSTIDCGMQLRGEGRGYKSLVALIRTHESMALKCLMNICYVPMCRPDIGLAGFVECIVELLERLSDVEWWPDGAMKTLAQLSEDSVNRSRLRHCGGLALLLAAARHSNEALKALLQYVFDDSALKILFDHGLMNLLSDELSTYTNIMECGHEYVEEKPIEKETSANCDKEERQTGKDVKSSKEAESDCVDVVIERDNMRIHYFDNGSGPEEFDSQPTGNHSSHKRKHHTYDLKTPMYEQSPEWYSSIYWEPMSPEYGQGSRQRSPAQCKRPKWDWSPDSGMGSGEGAASPSWSDESPVSPLSNSLDDSRSEMYSPVCSESESDALAENAEENVEREESGEREEQTTNEEGATDVVNDMDRLSVEDHMETEACVDDAEDSTRKTATLRISCVLVLWLQVAYRACIDDNQACPAELIVSVLTRAEHLLPLLEYVDKCRRPRARASKILMKILSNSLSLMPVLRTDFPAKLHNMLVRSRHPIDLCKQCRQVRQVMKSLSHQLSSLAESEYGIGEICYVLHRGPPPFRNSLRLTLPYYVRSPKALRKFFIEREGLNTLISMIEEKDGCVDDVVTALAQLATNFKIRDPKMIENTYEDCVQTAYERMSCHLNSDDLVTFQLDEGKTVTANKTFLCDNSEVFCAMLTGQFKESTQKNIRLQKVTKNGFEYLLTLLQKGLNEKQCSLRTFPSSESIEVSLEALLLADRFLLCEMRSRLRSAIVQFELNAQNVKYVYAWSQTDGMLELCAETVCLALVGDMSGAERAAVFASLLCSPYSAQWLNDVKTLILQHASPEFRDCGAR